MISAAEAEELLGDSIQAVKARSLAGERLSYHEKVWLRVWFRSHTPAEALERGDVTFRVNYADGGSEVLWDSASLLEPARARVDEFILRRSVRCTC